MAMKDWKKFNGLEWRNNEGDSLRIEKFRRDIIVWDVMLNNNHLYSTDNKQFALRYIEKYMRTH